MEDGKCSEQLTLTGTLQGQAVDERIIEPQPCTATIPQVTDIGVVFPDWP